MKSKKKEKTVTSTKAMPVFKSKEKMKSKGAVIASEYSSNWKKFLLSQKQLDTTSKKKKDEIPSKRSNGSNSFPRETKENGSVKGKAFTDKGKLGKKISSVKKRKKTRETTKTLDEVKSDPVWFDDIDPQLLEKVCGIKKNMDRAKPKKDVLHVTPTTSSTDAQQAPETSDSKQDVQNPNLTRFIALDCEMVGIGYEGKENALARVSLVNSLGDCIYDKFVKPAEKVVDYRTQFSGIRPFNLTDAADYEAVQKEVADMLKGRMLVGHALQNDLKVLLLSHSRRQIRDTAKYKPFRQMLKTKRPALKKLAAEILNKQIQTGEHSSVVDARVTMEIYQKYKKEWEHSLRTSKGNLKSEEKVIFMGNEQTKKRKINKWAKIRQRKKNKDETS